MARYKSTYASANKTSEIPLDYWQECSNSVWHTRRIVHCDRCGRKSEQMIECSNNEVTLGNYCFDRDCFLDVFSELVGRFGIFRIRMVVRKSETVKSGKRVPTGLALRFAVFKRDNFRCAICGKSGSEARLEVDHIVAVSNGGENEMTNLQLLCFECNRGKRNSI